MFRSILRLNSSKLRSVRYLKDHSEASSILKDKKLNELNEESDELNEDLNETVKKSRDGIIKKSRDEIIKKSRDERTKFSQQSTLNKNLIYSLKQFKSLEELLNFIQPKLIEFKLNQSEINGIFDGLRQLIFQSNYRKNRSLKESAEILTNSTIFNSLLNYTNELINQLDKRCLINLFDLLFTIRFNSHNQIMNNTLKNLTTKLNEFELDDFTICLKTIDLNTNYMQLTDQIIRFKQDLLMCAKNSILEHQFNSNEVDTMVNFFFRFLDPNNDPNFQIIKHLTKSLLSSEIDFKQSVKLLSKIQTGHSLFIRAHRRAIIRTDESNLYPSILEPLINKCNLVILKKFNSQPTKRDNFYFYLSKMHSKAISLHYQFENFHDQKLFQPLTKFVLENHEIIDINLIGGLVRNYSKIYRYDERLLKLIYRLLFSENLQNDTKFNFDSIYYLLAQHRLPFVDHQELLSKVLFNFSNDRSVRKVRNKVYLLTELILNDVNDEKLLNYLCERSTNFEGQSTFGSMEVNDFKRIVLAKVYLSFFSPLKDSGDFKLKIMKCLNEYYNQFLEMNRKPNISHKYIKIDSRLSVNGYLSNGIYLDAFAIYDKQTNDLICLKKYRKYFDRIDHIPIQDGQQEIVTFLTSYRLFGNISNYELNYNYQLKKVLNLYKIKPIHVFINDYGSLDVEDQIDFHIEKALDSYN